MLIYSNNNNKNSSDSLFGKGSYKSIHNREKTINRTQAVKRYTQQRQHRQQTKYIKERKKNLTNKNIKFLKSLGLQVKNNRKH